MHRNFGFPPGPPPMGFLNRGAGPPHHPAPPPFGNRCWGPPRMPPPFLSNGNGPPPGPRGFPWPEPPHFRHGGPGRPPFHPRGRGGPRGRGHVRPPAGPPPMYPPFPPKQQNFAQAHSQQKKKIRVDKRDLAENNIFRCDACDRGFKSDEIYQKHVSEHEQCPHEGCGYIAAPKLVRLHIQCQHVETSVGAQIWKSMSQEEIEKWRTDRRKNYPTKENMARKETEVQARAERGELIENRYFGKLRGRGGRHRRGRGGDWNDRGKRPADEEENSDVQHAKRAKPETVQNGEEHKLANGADPLSLPANTSGSDCTGAASCSTEAGKEATNSLACIASQYSDGEGSEDEEDKPEVTEIISDQRNQKVSKPRQEKQWHDRNSSVRRGRGQNYGFGPHRITLLQKLLANDIRHERNVILQCIHYIVKRDFFRVKQTSADADHQSQTEQECTAPASAACLEKTADGQATAAETAPTPLCDGCQAGEVEKAVLGADSCAEAACDASSCSEPGVRACN